MAVSVGYNGCSYVVLKGSRGGNLRCDCGNCPNGANLKDSRCLPRVLHSLDREFGITSLTLSHHIETEYVGDSMELLERMLSIKRLMERMSGRVPEPSDKDLSKCEKCELRPEMLFLDLVKKFEHNQGHVHELLLSTSMKLDKGKGSRCKACVERTKSDMVFLSGYLVPFWRWIQTRGED